MTITTPVPRIGHHSCGVKAGQQSGMLLPVDRIRQIEFNAFVTQQETICHSQWVMLKGEQQIKTVHEEKLQKKHAEFFRNMLYVTISCPFFNRRHAISKHVKRIEDYSMFHSPAFSLPLECNKLHKDRRMTLHCPPGLSKAHRHTWHIWIHLESFGIIWSHSKSSHRLSVKENTWSGIHVSTPGSSKKSTNHRARLCLLKRCPQLSALAVWYSCFISKARAICCSKTLACLVFESSGKAWVRPQARYIHYLHSTMLCYVQKSSS